MPESFNDFSPTRESSPAPARQGGAQGAINASPSATGTPVGGLDNMRANRRDYIAPDSRPTTSALKRTGAAVDTFADGVSK